MLAMTSREADDQHDGESASGADQPGLGELREAVASYARERLPDSRGIGRDAIAGLNSTLSSVPDGMASGLLAGVNPILGLYACIFGPLAGALFSSTHLMMVVTTSASALGAGQALGSLSGDDRANALVLLVLLIGASQVLFGLLGLGRLTRFVSYSVMTGFVAGIAALTVLTQLPTVTGYQPSAGNRLFQAFDLLTHLRDVHPSVVGVSGLALALVLALRRTFVGRFATLAAIVLPSAIVVLLSLPDVPAVRDVGAIPGGVPLPSLPSLAGVSADLVTGALAVSLVILVQGTGVSQSAPNPDGSRRSISRDFIAQGVGNLASGFFRGLPVGGSLSTTALSVLSGARSRWASVFAGLWMAAVVIALSGLVSAIAMPTLAAVLIVASISTIKVRDVESVWRTGWPARIASGTTFATTLVLPIQIAVGIGVALSALLYVYASAADVSIVELISLPDGRIEERKPPARLTSDAVTVLDVYGHLFFAGARTFERLLPKVEGSKNAAVVVRLRGRTAAGATLTEVLSRYAEKLRDAGGRLYLSGLSKDAYEHVADSGKLGLRESAPAYEATSILGESTQRAYEDARTWLVERIEDGPDAATREQGA
jgi:SulP family sulfate permease